MLISSLEPAYNNISFNELSVTSPGAGIVKMENVLLNVISRNEITIPAGSIGVYLEDTSLNIITRNEIDLIDVVTSIPFKMERSTGDSINGNRMI